MITVYNKQELQEALKNKGQKIRVEGSYANELAQKIHLRCLGVALGYVIHNKYKIVIKRGKDGEIVVELEPK